MFIEQNMRICDTIISGRTAWETRPVYPIIFLQPALSSAGLVLLTLFLKINYNSTFVLFGQESLEKSLL